MRRLVEVLRVSSTIVCCGAVGALVESSPLSAVVQETSLPDDLNYEIIKETTNQNQRRSLDVRLSRKATTEVLEALAIRLRDQAERPYGRTFIVYYLPEMEIDAGGWATSHFNPSLEVRILGTPSGNEPPRTDDAEIMGVWENNQPGSAGVYVISKTATGFQMERTFPDGSSRQTDLVQRPSQTGRRFEDPDNQFGEYWFVRGNNLELYDEEGLVFRARPAQ